MLGDDETDVGEEDDAWMKCVGSTREALRDCLQQRADRIRAWCAERFAGLDAKIALIPEPRLQTTLVSMMETVKPLPLAWFDKGDARLLHDLMGGLEQSLRPVFARDPERVLTFSSALVAGLHLYESGEEKQKLESLELVLRRVERFVEPYILPV